MTETIGSSREDRFREVDRSLEKAAEEAAGAIGDGSIESRQRLEDLAASGNRLRQIHALKAKREGIVIPLIKPVDRDKT
jgi:hypothetical protein